MYTQLSIDKEEIASKNLKMFTTANLQRNANQRASISLHSKCQPPRKQITAMLRRIEMMLIETKIRILLVGKSTHPTNIKITIEFSQGTINSPTTFSYSFKTPSQSITETLF